MRIEESQTLRMEETGAGAHLLSELPKDAVQWAHEIRNEPWLFRQILNDIEHLGVAGESRVVPILYLVGTSRLLRRPLASIVQGPSSSGKSFLIETVASLFPPETVIRATDMTPQALYYMPAGSLKHRFVVAGERLRAKNDEAASGTRALREMLSAGRLSKLLPVNDDDGNLQTTMVEQEGPIAYAESTTLHKVDDEDANRCLILHTDERPDQTRRIVSQIAELESGRERSSSDEAIQQRHFALQRMLKQHSVVIPFAEQLGALIKVDKVEVRRAFPQLLTTIKASALLHQYQRETDSVDRLVATFEDYERVRELLKAPMARALGLGMSDPLRRFYERLRTWTNGKFTSTDARKKESHGERCVNGWLRGLHEHGALDQIEKGRGPQPATWKLADDSEQIVTASDHLPTTDELRRKSELPANAA